MDLQDFEVAATYSVDLLQQIANESPDVVAPQWQRSSPSGGITVRHITPTNGSLDGSRINIH